MKFSNWGFWEDIKSAFIKAPKNENHMYVSQMYSAALTLHRNDAMKKRRELKNKDKDVQDYVKCSLTLMTKEPGGFKYSVY